MIDIRSYQWLSRVGAATYLDDSAPDAIILDECHKAKDLGRSVARRLRRYLEGKNPRVPVVAMTGTATKRSIRDYAHIVGWALGPHASPPAERLERARLVGLRPRPPAPGRG